MKVPREFLSFAVVGVVGFVVDAGVLYLAAPLLGWYGARVLSFLAAASATWALNRRFTFGARGVEAAGVAAGERVSIGREYLRYILSMLGGAVINYGVYVATLHALGGPWAPLAGVALGSIAGMALNFVLARQWVFGARPGH